MQYDSETYTADGWTRNQPKTMSDPSVQAIIAMAAQTPMKRISEDWVLSAADEMIGARGKIGPQIGQTRVTGIDNWKYFQAFGAEG